MLAKSVAQEDATSWPSIAWGVWGGRYLVPRQRQFRADLVVVNRCLDQLIGLARQCSEPEDLEALQQRDYSKARRPPPPRPRHPTGHAPLPAPLPAPPQLWLGAQHARSGRGNDTRHTRCKLFAHRVQEFKKRTACFGQDRCLTGGVLHLHVYVEAAG